MGGDGGVLIQCSSHRLGPVVLNVVFTDVGGGGGGEHAKRAAVIMQSCVCVKLVFVCV